MPFYERQPYVQSLHQLVAEVVAGEVRVPRFQRPGSAQTWTPEQRGDLLDSVYRGFPIGMILLWSTRSEVKTRSRVGPFDIPPLQPGNAGVQRLLLDGHQRLSTLVSILGRGLAAETGRELPPSAPDEERWVFDVENQEDAPRTRDRFVLLPKGAEPNSTQIDLGVALDRLQLNRWIRDHRELSPKQILLLDGLRDRIREYTIPVAVLAAESIDEATESFKRINSSGAPMGTFHMVAALAYGGSVDLQEAFAEQAEEVLAPLGWGDVDETDLLRVCVGLDPKTNPLKFGVEAAAARLRSDGGLVERTFAAAREAALILGECGVLGPKALPYAYQLTGLAVFIGRCGRAFTSDENEAMKRWFWLTTYGEVFAGVNSAIFDRAQTALGDMVAGGGYTAMLRDMTRSVEEPDRFDFRTARAKACALSMATDQDGTTRGHAHTLLATHGARAIEPLSRSRSEWWSCVIVPEGASLADVKKALHSVAEGAGDDAARNLLKRLGFPDLLAGDADALLAARRTRLARVEREFIGRLGLAWKAPRHVF